MTNDHDAPAAFAAARDLTDLQLVGNGLEFVVFRATHPAEGDVVLRVPVGGRFQSNANDPDVDTRRLLRWEHEVCGHLTGHGIAVAEPLELVLGEPDVLMSRYVPDDGAQFDAVELGGLLARLHRVPPPAAPPVASEGCATEDLVPRRIVRRWNEIAALVPGLPDCLPRELLRDQLIRSPRSLLHLDVRAANLRCVDGSVRALLDWSNALVGDPALELARLAEFARMPDNGIDFKGVLHGYGETPDLDDTAFAVYRLDAAVMLAVVFLCEAPDEALGAEWAGRARELHEEVARRSR
ncbi:phosphotransferase family protein [Lentzea sp. JNUCC 0626]|uniref:phosphotransferase family protein n=1 Tax=Lentzea sp. JNUCC 0626 TaxID=3367513 RepID=UPI003748D55A